MMRRAGSIIARASSGSRSSIKSIDPLMSTNSAVTVLRSPSMASVAGSALFNRSDTGPGAGRDSGTEMPTTAPHSPQNLSPVSMAAPHFGQEATKGVPQLVQNLRPSRLSLPHFEQRIDSSLGLWARFE